jgi:hypothetical protein
VAARGVVVIDRPSMARRRASAAARLAVAAGLAFAAGGCAWLGGSRTPPESAGSVQQVARADALASTGQPVAARTLYEQLTREPAPDAARAAARARALYRLGVLYVDPTSGLRDYRAARAVFDRLLSEHPGSEWEPEARAWRAALGEVFAREGETAQLVGQVNRLRAEAVARELESARLKDEAAKLKTDLDRLKRIDLNYERKR